MVCEDIAPTGQRLGLKKGIICCRAALVYCLISVVFSLQAPAVAQAQIQNSSFSSSLDDGPWQTFRNASTARPLLVSPQTGQLVPAPSGPLPSIGDVPQFSAPQFTSPQFQNTAPTPAPPGTQAFTEDFFSSPAQPSGPNSTGQNLPANPRPFSNPNPNNRNPQSGSSKIQITGRDSKTSLNFRSFVNPNRPDERVSLGVGGVRIVLDSPRLSTFGGDKNDKAILLADSVVQWQRTLPNGQQQNELYLEGNVVFSKGQRVIYAERMFYNVERSQGTILDAEVLTPVADYRGLLRLKAEVVRQIDENNLQAFNSAFTSSRIGLPRYWLQSQQLDLVKQPAQQTDPETGAALFDPTTGQPLIGDDYFARATGNRAYLGGVPIFSWPQFSTNLSDPSLYLNEFAVNNDNIFGTQIHAGFDLNKLFGFRGTRGTKWTGVLDYLSERGFGYGSKFDYTRQGLLGIPGLVQGNYRSWFINDSGQDFLGQDRFGLEPEEDNRGRVSLNHRHQFAPGYSLRAEVGYVSDRNFLEQFFEREWDTQKDATTGLWLERNFGTQSYNLTADVQINDFFTQTSWLPRFDQFTIGQPIFGNRALFSNHAHAGYAQLQVADVPTDPIDAAFFDPLAWEADVEGFRVGTRQELSIPLQLGPTKVVPYALTDFTWWQEALDGNDLFRVGGQVGVRGSVPIWKVDPTVQSELLNLNGLAHKVTFDFDASYADATQDIDELPLFDALDDDAQEHFRRRFAFNTFGITAGGDTPLEFDERTYALRSGLQGNVTSPSAEIFDDLSQVRFGVRQRWQTKRGAPGRERIIDLVNFDVQATLFPDGDRDNFGSDFGLLNYNFRWHLGDRLSVVSDAHLDFFSQGLRTVSVGVFGNRPEVGDLFVGLRSIEGPISSNVLTAIGTYRLSDKWGLKGGAQVDFGEVGSIGQRLGVVYIGESFLIELGLNYDASRDNLGFRFGFEPRFLPNSRLFRPGGVAIPPASSRWLE